jgi:hypothetical protein
MQKVEGSNPFSRFAEIPPQSALERDFALLGSGCVRLGSAPFGPMIGPMIC